METIELDYLVEEAQELGEEGVVFGVQRQFSSAAISEDFLDVLHSALLDEICHPTDPCSFNLIYYANLIAEARSALSIKYLIPGCLLPDVKFSHFRLQRFYCWNLEQDIQSSKLDIKILDLLQAIIYFLSIHATKHALKLLNGNKMWMYLFTLSHNNTNTGWIFRCFDINK